MPWNIFQQNIIFNWTQKLPPNSCFLLLCCWWKRGRQRSLWGKNYLDLAKRKTCFQQNLKELSCTWISSKRMAHGPNSVQCKWSLAIFKALATTEVSVDPSSLLSFLFFHAFSSQLKDYHGWFRIEEGKVQLTAFWQWPPPLQEIAMRQEVGSSRCLLLESSRLTWRLVVFILPSGSEFSMQTSPRCGNMRILCCGWVSPAVLYGYQFYVDKTYCHCLW